MDNILSKHLIRRQMTQMRENLPTHFVKESARTAGGFLASLPAFRQAECIMLYCDFRNEMGTAPLLSFCFRSGKRVILPLTDKNFNIIPYSVENPEQLSLSSLGILEPAPDLCAPASPETIGLVVVPGVAFDTSGHRIGYGKGCYDHFLPHLRKDVPIIGLAYDFQVLPEIPSTPEDVCMDAIITEKGLLTIAGAAHPIAPC